MRKADVPAGYLAERQGEQRSLGAYLTRSRRRADKDDVDGAVRVLSSIIEEHPAAAMRCGWSAIACSI